METAAKPKPELPKLAVASLVLGAAALVLSQFLFGGLLAVLGLVLGIFHIGLGAKGKPLAWAGVGLSAAALVIGAKMAMQVTSPFPEWVGVQAPDFSAETLDGREIKLSDFKGKRIVLNFWSTTCPPCVAEIPNLQKLHETASNEVVILGVTQDDPEILRKFIQRNGISYLNTTNMVLPEPYGSVRMIPTTFFIDRKGVIQDSALGKLSFEEFQKAALAQDYQGPIKPAPVTAPAAH